LEGINNPNPGDFVYEGATSREELLRRLFTFLFAEPTIQLSDTEANHVYEPVSLIATPGFEGTGTFETADIAEYRWDLGDGSTVVTTTVPTLTYFYDRAGAYTVRVEVADVYGHKALAQATARVANPIYLPIVLKSHEP
jgi:hypothetical protein